MSTPPDNDLYAAALAYHRAAPAGKLTITPTKPLVSQRDLSLAYSPGVAAACEAIKADPEAARSLTARGNLVAVITNGTAVLGLGAIGPLAAKPVMEGKAVLFRKFAGIDAIDIEVDALDPERMVEVVAALEPSFGGINLEDVKAPDCFYVESELRRRMAIPVFHDDQHGTAIIVAAAIRNWLRLSNRKLAEIKLVSSGAGAAAIACLDLLCDMGLPESSIWVTDIGGVVHLDREDLTPDDRRRRFARTTNARTLDEVIEGADVFLGLSAPRVLRPEMVRKMGPSPLVLALANPTPEIMPDQVAAVRPDAITATGRSDFPNQVNNVLCFPYIFRGALDVGATAINEAMKIAAVEAIADLAMAPPSDIVAAAYGDQGLSFGPDYIIPKPFDPRLILQIAPAVARAAMESGVATRPITDWDAYHQQLSAFIYRSGQAMRPIFAKAKEEPKRIAFAEGEEPTVLQAAQAIVDEGIARPLLIGRPDVMAARLAKLGLRLQLEKDFDLVDPTDDPRYREYWQTLHELRARHGMTPALARDLVRTNTTVIGSLLLIKGEADGLICGLTGHIHNHLRHVRAIVGYQPGESHYAALSALILPRGTFFFADTHFTFRPTAEELAATTRMAAKLVERFGFTPKVALCSHSSFGSHRNESTHRLRAALEILRQTAPDLDVDGEMSIQAALNPEHRSTIIPDGRLSAPANLLIMPDLDSANIGFSLLRELGDGQNIGPMLMGSSKPVHIVAPGTTMRALFNLAAVMTVEVQTREAAAG